MHKPNLSHFYKEETDKNYDDQYLSSESDEEKSYVSNGSILDEYDKNSNKIEKDFIHKLSKKMKA